MNTILCKWRGALVLMEVSKCKDGNTGKCPDCGNTKFTKIDGWAECDCGFAFLYIKEYEVENEYYKNN